MVSQSFSTDFPSCGAPYSHPFRLSFHSHRLSPPWVHALNPTFQHPAPFCNRWLIIQAGMCRAVVDHVCSFYFVLPSTDHLLRSPFILWRSFSVPADFPTVMEFFLVWDPPLTFSFPPGLLVPFWIPLFFLSSFFHSFRCPKSSANVQQVPCGNCSVCRWILCVFVRSDEFHILLVCHLDYSPPVFPFNLNI